MTMAGSLNIRALTQPSPPRGMLDRQIAASRQAYGSAKLPSPSPKAPPTPKPTAPQSYGTAYLIQTLYGPQRELTWPGGKV